MSDTILLKKNFTKKSYYIKFYPEIKSSIGCEKATLILGRLEYWFEKYKSGFYKFIEPCQHPLYRDGDSWEEEIGFSRKIFAKAFDLVGVRYKSKSAFMKEVDKFKGKLYASYHDRKTNQTYFVRNHKFASQFISGLFNQKQSSKTQKIAQVVAENCFNKTVNPSPHISRSRNGQKGRSFGGTIGGNKNNSIQRKTSSLERSHQKCSNHHSESSQRKMTEEMIKIWQEEIGDLGISSLSKGFLKRLQNSLKNFFECSLESWKVYCQMIASSKFLMGEAQNKFFKKAWITWAIKEEAIKRIKGGDFNLGDRKTNEDKKIEEISNEIKNLENKKKEVEQTIKYIKNSLKNERIKKVKEKKTFLSEGEIDNFKLEFIKFLETENNSITEEFRKFGWNGIFVDSYFESFVKDQIMIVLFSNTLTDEIDKSIKKCGLLEVLKKIDNEICLVQHKKNILMTKNFEKLL